MCTRLAHFERQGSAGSVWALAYSGHTQAQPGRNRAEQCLQPAHLHPAMTLLCLGADILTSRQVTALSREMEHIQIISFPRITSFLSPKRCPRKNSISTPSLLTWQPPSSSKMQCKSGNQPNVCSTHKHGITPWLGSFSQPSFLASRIASSHYVPLVLVSLLMHRSEMQM